jgi:hypothetical protein
VILRINPQTQQHTNSAFPHPSEFDDVTTRQSETVIFAVVESFPTQAAVATYQTSLVSKPTQLSVESATVSGECAILLLLAKYITVVL